MIRWEEGIVKDIIQETEDRQVLSVKIEHGETIHYVKALLYTLFFPRVKPGDVVHLNATARHIGLGTGGFDFVCRPPSDDESKQQPISAGHMMKLRYTPLQVPVLAAEEATSPYHKLFNEKKDIAHVPVLIGELHSMLPAAVAWIMHIANQAQSKQPRIVYVMSDGGALPIAFSEHVTKLKELGWLAGTVTYGHAFGGDIETMNKFSALIAARHILQADIIIVTMGPGMAGTGTRWGHTGLETGELINAVSILKGQPIMIPRISFADQRQRHIGLSHHLITTLSDIAMRPAIVPLPSQISDQHKRILLEQANMIQNVNHPIRWMDQPDMEAVAASHQAYRAPITTMGRTCAEDAEFFLGVAAAAHIGWECMESRIHH